MKFKQQHDSMNAWLTAPDPYPPARRGLASTSSWLVARGHHDCGAWASRKNKALVERNRRALAALRADGTTVRFQHVRAHAGHGMNEHSTRFSRQKRPK